MELTEKEPPVYLTQSITGDASIIQSRPLACCCHDCELFSRQRSSRAVLRGTRAEAEAPGASGRLFSVKLTAAKEKKKLFIIKLLIPLFKTF